MEKNGDLGKMLSHDLLNNYYYKRKAWESEYFKNEINEQNVEREIFDEMMEIHKEITMRMFNL